MPSLIWRHDGPRLENGGRLRLLAREQPQPQRQLHGFFDSTARRTGVTVTFDDIFYLRPRVITVTDACRCRSRPVFNRAT